MVRFYFFLFIFIQACSPIGGLLNLNRSDSKTNDYWWVGLLQGNNHPASIENSVSSNEDVSEENVLNADTSEWTLLVGAPNGNTLGSGLAIDTNGFIYVAGDTDVGVYSENPIGNKDIILTKYNSRKQIIWSKQVGSRGVDLDVADVGVDARGNVYVIASRSIAIGDKDLFVIKFDTNGNEIWRRQTNPGGRNYAVYPEKIFVDSSGTSYIVGTLSTRQRNFANAINDGFFIKIDTQGNWGNPSHIFIHDASIFLTGVVVAKDTGDTFITGAASADLETNTTPGIGNLDLVVLKYDRNGRRQRFTQLGQALSTTKGNSIALDSFGNVFVGGTSNANFELEGGIVESDRGILVKYDPLGVRQWIRYLGPADGARTTSITAIITDSKGNVFTTGKTNHMEDGRENVIGMDLLLTKHDSLGNEEWIRQTGFNGGRIIGKRIGQDLQGNLYCTGWTDVFLDNENAQRQGDINLLFLKFR
ncbi:beta-propeller repeat protein [Leptospira weilii serovar Topaz str. LT2116]|uniref:Beta-propeller repeat protein n=1 Tax=Leptospira weilii serovar Topaz str. LT2116 TaxID=1088540 RepID=M3FI69_9LEPT|nr:beta-propeller repeat protein [Leptospira weilii serovar Topaz str. LT2116]